MQLDNENLEFAEGIFENTNDGAVTLKKITVEISEDAISAKTEKGYMIMGLGSTTLADGDNDPFTFILATQFETCPSEVIPSRAGYLNFIYEKGDVFVLAPVAYDNREDIYFVADITNIEAMMNLNLSGKTPNNLPYSLQFELMRMNGELNVPLDVPVRTDEFYVAALFVGEDNKPYRLSKKCQSGDEFSYKAIKVEEAGRVANTFGALTGRNIELGLLTSLTLDPDKELPTVLEKPAKL